VDGLHAGTISLISCHFISGTRTNLFQGFLSLSVGQVVPPGIAIDRILDQHVVRSPVETDVHLSYLTLIEYSAGHDAAEAVYDHNGGPLSSTARLQLIVFQ
jgi:hypothetical protein